MNKEAVIKRLRELADGAEPCDIAKQTGICIDIALTNDLNNEDTAQFNKIWYDLRRDVQQRMGYPDSCTYEDFVGGNTAYFCPPGDWESGERRMFAGFLACWIETEVE
jgi:hypothetical protein